jgi:hypothetical protein
VSASIKPIVQNIQKVQGDQKIGKKVAQTTAKSKNAKTSSLTLNLKVKKIYTKPLLSS